MQHFEGLIGAQVVQYDLESGAAVDQRRLYSYGLDSYGPDSYGLGNYGLGSSGLGAAVDQRGHAEEDTHLQLGLREEAARVPSHMIATGQISRDDFAALENVFIFRSWH